jgi:hypothetical protein
MATIAQLNAAVARDKDVKDSAILALKGQLDIIRDAGTPAERDKAIADLTANTDALAAAVVANTPIA